MNPLITYEEVLAKPVEEQRILLESIWQEIMAFDRLPYAETDYTHRNQLAETARNIDKQLPFLFSVGQEVLVPTEKGRKIRGIIKELQLEPFKSVCIKPSDSVYKEIFWTSERILKAIDVNMPESEAEQLSLF